MKVSVVFMLGLVLLPQIDNSVSQEHLKALTRDTHAMQAEGYGTEIHPAPSFESRKDKGGKGSGKGKGKGRGRGRNRNSTNLGSGQFNVTVLPGGKNVTYLTLGNHTFQFMGNWSLHMPCLAPCNLNHPHICTERGPNCTCVARNDRWGVEVGVCAKKDVPLGSGDYGHTTAFMPSR
uniref:Putative secreted protein n=1 Tax=Amblyomma parvum TaxID=251391 RepID=A0A023G2V1_AMBPA